MAASATSGAQGAQSHQTSLMATSIHGVGRNTRADYTNRFFEFLCTLQADQHSGWKMPYFIFFMEYFQWWVPLLSADIPWGGSQQIMDMFEYLRLDFAAYFGEVVFVSIFGLLAVVFCTTLFAIYFLTIRKVKHKLALKTLRTLCILQATVLYVPILNILLTPIDCTTATEESRSLNTFYENETCWEGAWLVTSAVSVLLAPIFLFFGSAINFMFFDNRLRHGKPTASPSGRLPALLTLCKGLSVLSFKVIHRDVRLRLFIYLSMAVFLTGYYVRRLPYYNSMVNALAAGFLTSSLVGAAAAFVQTYIDPAVSMLYVFCASLGIGFILGIAMVIARVKYLSVKTLAFLEQSGAELDEVLQKAPQGLLDDAGDIDIQDKYNLHTLFSEPEMVEVCSRFVGRCAKSERRQRMKRVLVAGLVRFPNEAILSNAFANYALTYLRDGLLASIHIKHAKGSAGALDTHYVNLSLEKWASQVVKEHSLGNGDMDAVSFVEFQKSFKLAKHYHVESLTSIQAFWYALCSEDVDINTIPALTNKISQNEQKAMTVYTSLVAKYPTSKPLFLSYGRFQEYVRRDVDKALACYEMVEGLEEDAAMADRSQAGRPTHSEASAGGGSIPGSSHRSSDRQRMNGQSDNLASMRKYREILKNRRSNAVDRLSSASIISVLVPFILAFVCLGSFEASASTATRMSSLGLLASDRIKSVETAVLYTRYLEDYARAGDIDNFNAVQAKLLIEMEEFRTKQQELFHETYRVGFSELDYYWELLFPVKVVISGDHMADVDMNLWDACNVFINAAVQISKYPMERMRTLDDFRVRILYDNAAGDLKKTLMDAQSSFGANISSMYDEIMVVQSLLVSLCVLVLIVLGVGAFRPALKQITTDRFQTLNVFLEIPKNVVRRIHKGIKTTLDDDENANDGRHRRDALGATYSNGEKGWEDALIKNTSVKYTLALGLIGVLFFAALVTALVQLNTVVNAGIELDAAGQRSQLARSLHRLSRELVQASNTRINITTALGEEPHTSEIIAEIREAAGALSDVHFFIKFGNNEGYHGTEKRYPPLEDLMYQRECLRNRPCTEEELSTKILGLDAYINSFIEMALELSYSSLHAVEVNATLVTEISDIEENIVGIGLKEGNDMLVQEKMMYKSYIFNTWASIMGVIAFLSVAFYVFVFMGLVAKLRDVTDKTGGMLLMIPPEVIEKVPAVKAFLESGLAIDAEARIQQELQDARLTNNAIVNHKDAEPLVVITEVGEIMAYNHAAYKLFGYTETEVLGKNVRMLMPGQYASKHDGYLKRYMETGEKKMLKGMRELNIRKKNGKQSPVELTVDEVILVGGETMVDGRKRERRVFTAILKDIASLKAALGRLNEQMTFSESIMNTSTGALIVIEEDGVVVKVNRAAERLFKYEADQLLGENVKMLMMEEDALHHDGYLEIARRDKGTREIGFQKPMKAVNSHGKVIDIGLSISQVDVGSQTFYAAFMTDDTEMRKREAEIVSEKIFNEAVVDTSTAGIIVMDELGIVAKFNRAAEHIFQYSQHEIIGQNVKVLMPHRYASRHDDYISTYLRTGVRHVIGIGRILEGQRKDLSEVVLRVAVAEVEVSGARWFTGFLHDETQRVEVERQMTEDRKFSESVVDTSMSGVIVISNVGIVKKFNIAATKILGYGPEEVIGKNVKMLMPERVAAQHDMFLSTYKETGVRKMIGIGRAVRAKHKLGREVDVDLNVGEIEVQGQMWFTGFLRDITEQVAMDTAITRQKKYADAIVENSYSGVVVIDEEGTVASFNRSAEGIFGYTASEVRGKNVKILMPQRFARDHDKFLANYKKTGVAKMIGIGRVMNGLTKSGREVVVKLDVSKTIIEGITWYTGLVEDHTERVEREAKMAREQKFSAAVIDTSMSAIVVMSEEGLVRKFNHRAQEMFGYEAKEVIGKNVSMLMPDDVAAEHNSYLSNYVKTGNRKMIGIGRDVVGKRKDGTFLHVALQVGENFIETERLGSVRWFTGFLTDITREMNTRQEVESNKRFAAAVVDVCTSAVILIDSKGTVEQFNEAAAAIFGYPADLVVGRNVSMLMPPAHAAEHDGYIKRYMDTGEAHILRKTRSVLGLGADGNDINLDLTVVELTIDGTTWFSGFAVDMTVQSKEMEETRRTVQLGRALTTASKSCVVVSDDSGKILKFNEATVKLLGHTEADMVGKNVKLLMPQRYARSHDSYLSAYKRTGVAKVIGKGMETFALRKDGKEIPIRINIGRVEMGGRSVFTAIMDDVSGVAETKAEEAEATVMLDAMTNACPNGMVVTDASGVILRANPTVLELLQYTAAEMLGQNVTMLMPDRFADDHQEHMRRYSLTRIPSILGQARDLTAKRKDGEEIDVALTVRESVAGNELYFTGTFVDKSKEVDFHTVVEMEKTVVESLPVAAVAITPDGTVTLFNGAAEALFGHAADAVVGRNVKMLMPAQTASKHDAYLTRFRSTGKKRVIGKKTTQTAMRADGTKVSITLVVNVFGAGSAIGGYVALIETTDPK